MTQNALFLASLIGLIAGGVWVWAPFVATNVLINVVDDFGGADRTLDEAPPVAMHARNLYLTVVLLVLNATFFAYHFGSGDPLGLAALLHHVGIDLEASRKSTSSLDLILALFAQGFNYSVAISSAHELMHCADSRIKMALSNWIGALVLNPWFMTHHVARHHRYVGLPCDVGTARRGMSVYGYIARSVPGNYAFAARYEKERMARRGLPQWSLQNRFVSGWIILIAIAGFFLFIGGPLGLLAFVASGVVGRVMVESIDYVQHYGLLRVEDEPVTPRLSWDVYRPGTNAILNNLGRHADHHEHPARPSVELHVNADAPELPIGYLKLVTITLVPPLFFKIMQPRLDAWDRDYATGADIAFMKANGIRCFER
ncbi:fatty acid desaturase [Rhodoblastus acidophilus]|uniref:Fatty acid desaturase n=1 Tax=Candidatus Rhodoblastus alkanivorans TaxID=2954117 RepID=A0ABS9Z7I6_9HYPH|nr:fatty acid desaturase [Candidatus Rhodoblastus alkanivorans]MCI4678376.1 fatty acid desaturase [Candidatus Rhodoblastus alkanivorans]MCI4683634.1 fatty acid desaturase [Candidatus Rhodoblastus alkanivorans]MDI4640950.1 fatty acid desaturase [Rhodoblastus acidophilus]